MVKRFEPEVKTTYYPYEENPYIDAIMKPLSTGNWVKYETHKDTVAQLTKQLNKLKRKLNNDFTSNSPRSL